MFVFIPGSIRPVRFWPAVTVSAQMSIPVLTVYGSKDDIKAEDDCTGRYKFETLVM